MVTLYNSEHKKIAILENAFEVSENQVMNGISKFCFSLPGEDPKNKLCKPFSYVQYKDGALYRILPTIREEEEMGILSYECEHVIATLLDNVLFGHHIIGNLGYPTDRCIRYILDHQIVKNWVLDRCDFLRQYQYGFEQENLLGALFSLPKPVFEPYLWEFNTAQYPWKLSLRQIDPSRVPSVYLRPGKNRLRFRRSSDPKQICTRLYPLGYGEGVNQLGIKEINGGLPYIQSSPEVVAKYGIVERVWSDRRYEDQASLLSAAKAMLAELQEPIVEYEVEFAALRPEEIRAVKLGAIVEILDEEGAKFRTYITGIQWDYDEITQSKITVANKPVSIAQTVADLADRQRIEMTYSQGATQLYAQSLQANADSKDGAKLHFYIPQEMRIINKVQAKVRLEEFRSYSKATTTQQADVYSTKDGHISPRTTSDGGVTKATAKNSGVSLGTALDGAINIRSTENGGAKYPTTDWKGRTEKTTEDGGDNYPTTTDDGYVSDSTYDDGGSLPVSQVDSYLQDPDSKQGGHNHGIPAGVVFADKDGRWWTWVQSGDHTHRVEIPRHNHGFKVQAHNHTVKVTPHRHEFLIPDHSHTVDMLPHQHEIRMPLHKHSVEIPGHQHEVTISDHRHTVEIPDHQHTITIPAHAHEVTPGIYRFGGSESFLLYVNGSYKGTIYSADTELDLTEFLLDKDRRIRRGQWQSVEIRPTGLAYVSMDLFVQGFVQSRGDATV